MAEELERIFVIPLTSARFAPGSRRADVAIKGVKKFLSRHMKVEEEKVWIASSLNQSIWTKGKHKIPSTIRVKAIKFSDGQVEASLPGEPITSREESEKEKKALIRRKGKEEKPKEKPKSKEEPKPKEKSKLKEKSKTSEKSKKSEKK